MSRKSIAKILEPIPSPFIQK